MHCIANRLVQYSPVFSAFFCIFSLMHKINFMYLCIVCILLSLFFIYLCGNMYFVCYKCSRGACLGLSVGRSHQSAATEDSAGILQSF